QGVMVVDDRRAGGARPVREQPAEIRHALLLPTFPGPSATKVDNDHLLDSAILPGRSAMQLLDVLRLVRRHAFLIVAVTVIGVSIGGFVGLFTPPRYQATTDVMLTVQARSDS